MDQNQFNPQFDNGVSRTQHQMPAKPKNNLALAIISTILGMCSCIGLILGIVAIVMATQSNTKYANGDYEGAVKAAKNAKILSFIVLGLVALSIIYMWVSIQAVGGWSAYMEIMNEAMRQGQAAGM